jgi:hypothetical protein
LPRRSVRAVVEVLGVMAQRKSSAARSPWSIAALGGMAIAFFWWAEASFAYRDGITGFSGLQGLTCVDRCHGDAAAPIVSVEGPASVSPGALVSWRIRVEPGGAGQVGAGVNVGVRRGQLSPGAGLYEEDGELTHFAPQRSADTNADGRVTAADVVRVMDEVGMQRGEAFCSVGDANGDRRTDPGDLLAVAERIFFRESKFAWTFLWQAPSQPQVVEFFAAVVGANCNGTNGGDGFARASWQVQVGTSRSLQHP